MSRLILYGDESGTMPLQDNEDPFVAAIIAATAPLVIREPVRHGIRGIVAQAVASGCAPFFAYVLPITGYGDAVREKYA